MMDIYCSRFNFDLHLKGNKAAKNVIKDKQYEYVNEK